MSDTRDIAEHVTSLCAGLVALALPAAVGVAPLAVPLVVLATIGFALRNSSAKRAGERAVGETLAALERAGEFRSEHVAAALELLRDDARSVSLSPSELSAAAQAEDFDGELARKLAEPLTFYADPSVREVLVVAFRVSVAVLRRDDAFHRGLTQTLLFEAARASGLQLDLLSDIKRDLENLRRDYGSLSEALNVVRHVSRYGMETLASRFEIERAFALSDVELREALEKKAEEYRAYLVRIEAIDEGTAGLGSLKAAARDAAERLDFDEVEGLLALVDEVETETAAETKGLRADNALLLGRVEDAFRMLSAAADGFASLSSAEAASRRIKYAKRLYDHGLRYGSAGLALAERMAMRALDDLSESSAATLWASAHNARGAALLAQGERLGGAAGAELFRDAEAAFRAALRVLTEAADPVDWAGTQTNLGAALQEQGKLLGEADGTRLLGEAVSAYRAALRVQTEAAYPDHWATTQNNLGNALQAQGKRLGAAAAASRLGEAVEAYSAALRVRNEASHPDDWAKTQSNLGNALSERSRRLGETAGAKLLGKAIAAYRAALRVWTQSTHPVYWAQTEHNLGNTFQEAGTRLGGVAGKDLLSRALASYDAALRVWTEAAHPGNWAQTQNSLGSALQVQGKRVGGAVGLELLGRGVEAYLATLRVWTETAQPVLWASAQGNLAFAYEALSENEAYADPFAALGEAARCLKAALRVFDLEHMPSDHDRARAALAQVRAKLGREGA